MAYDLGNITEVVRVLNLVEKRKRQASNYDSMASKIAQELGKRMDHDETYEYREDGLRISEKKCFDSDSDYRGSIIDIRVPYPSSTGLHPLIFNAGEIIFYSDAGKITTYRPGEWEKRLQELYEPLKPKIQPLEKRIQVPNMTERELEDLKDRFGIE